VIVELIAFGNIRNSWIYCDQYLEQKVYEKR